ncbi:tetratricopeptide repeat protein [Tropicibacter sp. S64]|uniref:tetratricopeptide repeat protein n=1 Tax=Tropicibacter sp. S64 TaxID=3415122 RepID=UPI003C7B1C2A
MQQLRAALETEGQAAITAVVQGHGGYGKSALARLYIERFGATYDGVLWCVAENPSELATGLLAAADDLGVTVAGIPPQVAAAQVLARMAAQGHWLVVYDNVHGYDDIKGLMPQKGTDLIVTTREKDGWGQWTKVHPQVLPWDGPDSPAVELLLSEAGSDDAEGAQSLAEALGGLPLALVVAGALARHDGFATVERRIAEVLETAPLHTDYPDSVIGAVALSYDKLDEDARRVADICAWWGAEGLGAELFTGGKEGRHRALDPEMIDAEDAALADNETRLRMAFTALAGASLMTREQDGFAMHRMTAAALRAMQETRGEDRAVSAAVELLAVVFPYDSDFSINWPLCAHLLPHVTALWDSIEPMAQGREAPGGAALEYLLNQAGVYLGKIGDHAGEIALMTASLSLTRARLPEDHRDNAVGLANLGIAEARLGNFDAAEEHLAEALALSRTHRPGSTDLANKLDNAAWVRVVRVQETGEGDLEAAFNWQQEALDLYRANLGDRSDKVATVLNNQAVMRSLQGRVGEAAALAGQALDIRRVVLDPEDDRLGSSLLNVGVYALKSGHPAKAEPLLQDAYDLWSKLHAARPRHEHLLNAASWLVACKLVRARTSTVGNYLMDAKRLCQKHGLDLAKMQATAAQYPSEPPA